MDVLLQGKCVCLGLFKHRAILKLSMLGLFPISLIAPGRVLRMPSEVQIRARMRSTAGPSFAWGHGSLQWSTPTSFPLAITLPYASGFKLRLRNFGRKCAVDTALTSHN